MQPRKKEQAIEESRPHVKAILKDTIRGYVKKSDVAVDGLSEEKAKEKLAARTLEMEAFIDLRARQVLHFVPEIQADQADYVAGILEDAGEGSLEQGEGLNEYLERHADLIFTLLI